MKKLLLPFLFIGLLATSASAQTTYDIEVASFSFTPAALTIEVGDMVTWTNMGGTHNVNGTTATYSSNPDSFGNSVGAGWTYSFTFTVAGDYDYHCDPHSGFMTGTITVVDPSSINESDLIDNAVVYPNPFTSNLSIKLDKSLLNDNNEIEFVLYDLLGNQVYEVINIESEITNITTENLSKGIYIYAFKSAGKTLKTGKLRNNL